MATWPSSAITESSFGMLALRHYTEDYLEIHHYHRDWYGELVLE